MSFSRVVINKTSRSVVVFETGFLCYFLQYFMETLALFIHLKLCRNNAHLCVANVSQSHRGVLSSSQWKDCIILCVLYRAWLS